MYKLNGHCAIYFIHMLGKQKVNLKLTQKTTTKQTWETTNLVPKVRVQKNYGRK